MKEAPTYYFDLSSFLQRLSNEGFHIGIDTHLYIQEIKTTLASNDNPVLLESLLMPLICKSEKQQLLFHSIFRQFLVQKMEEQPSELPSLPAPKVNRFQQLIAQIQVGLQNIQSYFQAWDFSFWKRKAHENTTVAKQERGLASSDYKDLFAEVIPVNISDNMMQSIAHLRTREPLGIKTLDIEQTVTESIKNIGAFTPIYQDLSRYTEYLILIQSDNPDDHKAKLYNSFYEELQYRNIPSSRYYFRTAATICYNETYDTGIALKDLVHKNTNAVLIVFAQLNTFLRPPLHQPYPWTAGLKKFPLRFLLLPFGAVLEAKMALALRSVFKAILPATELGFQQLEDYLNGKDKNSAFGEFIRLKTNISTFPIVANTKEEIETLVHHLGDVRLLKWIAACAVYPDFSWKMTLFLGQLLSNEYFTYNTWDNIRQLARLNWFKEAYMPPMARRTILKSGWLSSSDIETIKKGILKVFRDNKRTGFQGNLPQFLTRIYLSPSNEAQKEGLKSALEQEVDYITARLIKSRFRDILFFELPEDWEVEENKMIEVEEEAEDEEFWSIEGIDIDHTIEKEVKPNQDLGKEPLITNLKDINELEEVNIDIRILPEGDEYEIELSLGTTGAEITNGLVDAEILEAHLKYKLYSERTGLEIYPHDNLMKAEIQDNDLVVIKNNGLKEVSIVLRILPEGNEYDMELPLSTTGTEITNGLVDAEILEAHLKYKLYSGRTGLEIYPHDNLIKAEIQDNDLIVIKKSRKIIIRKKNSKVQEKRINELEEVSIVLRILPEGDEYDMELLVSVTGSEITNGLVDAEILEVNQRYVLQHKRTGLNIYPHDNLMKAEIQDNDLILVKLIEVDIVVRILPEGDEYDMELPLDTMGSKIINELVDAGILEAHLRYKLYSERTGLEISLHDNLMKSEIQNNDVIIIKVK